jgi:hypothetical protein
MTDRRVNSLEYLGLHRHQHTNVTADIAQEAETPSARPTSCRILQVPLPIHAEQVFNLSSLPQEGTTKC